MTISIDELKIISKRVLGGNVKPKGFVRLFGYRVNTSGVGSKSFQLSVK